MSEIRTSPVEARHTAGREEFRCDPVRAAGSFRVDDGDEDGEHTFWYCCPCGCGTIGALIVGNGFKPDVGPSWNWNGSYDKPTLHPSVNHVGHWHGWLRDGTWISC